VTVADVLLTADSPGLFSSFGQPQWGIFDATSGSPILEADSVFSIEYARDYRISDYQQEQGAFASYNKVQVPFQAKISFLANGLRYNFLAQAEPACASLGLVTVVMPEFAYPSANLTHYGFRRAARSGKTLILFDVWCEEVRVLASSTSTPSAAGAGGTVAGAAATSAGATNVANGTTLNNTAGSVGNAAVGTTLNSAYGQTQNIATQSTNGVLPAQSGQVQPSVAQPTVQGGITGVTTGLSANSFAVGNSIADAGGAADPNISYSWTPPTGSSSTITPPGGTTGTPALIGSQSQIQ